jgi:pimeloyl-ACP methyl ester carboxylesterase
MEHATSYRTIEIDGLSIFYREAGPKDAPTLLLLHGLPSSSRMFEPLFARLSDRYHLVAPDYPGFAITPISGRMNSIFSTSRDSPIFKATSSMTIERTSTPTPRGKHGCARNSRACW